MAQKVSISLTDDLDGSVATETVAFSIDGTSYELDLNARNASAFRKTFEKYVNVSRKVGRGHVVSPRRARRSSGSTVDASAVRAWAAANKIKVSNRGRISAEVLAQFQAAGH